MAVSEPLVYLNGRMVPASQASLPIYDAGIVQGATVSEMTRTFRHRLFRLEDHLRRLDRSLRYAGFETGLSIAELSRISHELIEQNAKLVGANDDLGLIHFVTAGPYATYAGMAAGALRPGPTVCLHTFPLPFLLWAEKMRSGAHVMTPRVRQVPAECVDPQVKCRSRMHYYLADQEVRRTDPAAIALLLDLAGNVTETNAGNFLIVERGTIVSPPTETVLPGISRQTVIELAQQLGIPFVERALPVDEAAGADEALLASTPFCLLPVTRFNGRAIGDGRPGPVFERLLAAWSELIGYDIRQQILAGA